MSGVFKKFKKILKKINKLDIDTKKYEKMSQVPSIPSEAFVNMGLYWVSIGETEKAIEQFKTSSLMANPSPDAYINVGIYQAQNGEFEAAAKSFRAAIKIDRNNARAYSLWASVLSEVGDLEQAEAFYEKANKLESRDSDIYLNWGISLAKQNKKEQAADKFKKAFFYNPLNFRSLYLWGVVLTELGKYDFALEKLVILLTYTPENADAYYYSAYCNYKLEQFEKASSLCEKAIQLNPNRVDAYILAAEIDFKQSKGAELLKHYEKAEELGITNIHLYNSWAIMLQSFGYFKDAREKNLQVLQLETYHEQALLNLAICDYNLHDYIQAKQTLEKFFELYPQNYEASALMAKVYIALEMQDNAIEVLLKVVNETNSYYELYCDIANIYSDKGEIELAAKYYSKTLEYVPECIEAYIKYAKLLCDNNDTRAALRKIRTAYSLNKNDVRVVFTYGVVLLCADMYEEALKKFNDAAELAPDMESINIGKAEALHNLGRDDEALNAIEKLKTSYSELFDYVRLCFEIHYTLAQNTNSAYNIEQALALSEKLEKFSEVKEELSEKIIKLRERNKK